MKRVSLLFAKLVCTSAANMDNSDAIYKVPDTWHNHYKCIVGERICPNIPTIVEIMYFNMVMCTEVVLNIDECVSQCFW